MIWWGIRERFYKGMYNISVFGGEYSQKHVKIINKVCLVMVTRPYKRTIG